MAQVTYKGDHAAVFVVVDGMPVVEAKNGEPVDVPAALARDLLDSPVWHPVATAKPARRKAKANDTADMAENGAE